MIACRNGHPYDVATRYVRRGRGTECRECKKATKRRLYRRKEREPRRWLPLWTEPKGWCGNVPLALAHDRPPGGLNVLDMHTGRFGPQHRGRWRALPRAVPALPCETMAAIASNFIWPAGLI